MISCIQIVVNRYLMLLRNHGGIPGAAACETEQHGSRLQYVSSGHLPGVTGSIFRELLGLP